MIRSGAMKITGAFGLSTRSFLNFDVEVTLDETPQRRHQRG
jgi:hypothetical protein